MRTNIVMLAGLGLVLAGCGHSSSHSTTGTAKAAPAAPAKTAANSGGTSITPGVTPTPTVGYPLAAKGLGLLATNGESPSQVSLTGTVKETTNLTGPAPITFVEAGDAPLHGTSMSSSRTNQIDSSTRFLMSEQSASSKDAPTAFGILIDHSVIGQFAAGAYYGGSTATNIPKFGTATYKGNYAGSQSFGANMPDGISGDFAMTADFAAGKVKGDIRNIQSKIEDGPSSFSFTSTMGDDKASYATGVGDTISANLHALGGGQTPINGRVEGGFYGQGAAETAGAITTVDGTNPIVGTFYGKKQ
jgi:hypothetical protein